MKTRIEDLEGQELDKAVADILGIKVGICIGGYLATEESIKYTPYSAKKYSPSTDWAQGGPIIDEYKISIQADECIVGAYLRGNLFQTNWSDCFQDGATALIAAMKCFVKSNEYKGHENAFFPKEAAIGAKANWNNL